MVGIENLAERMSSGSFGTPVSNNCSTVGDYNLIGGHVVLMILRIVGALVMFLLFATWHELKSIVKSHADHLTKPVNPLLHTNLDTDC